VIASLYFKAHSELVSGIASQLAPSLPLKGRGEESKIKTEKAMRQKVTLGYFERDEAGRMLSRSREVIVEAGSGDEAAAQALAEHGAELERLAGYDPGQTSSRVAVLGVDTATGDVEATPSEACAAKGTASKSDVKKGRRQR
jgi:hypothetical protein